VLLGLLHELLLRALAAEAQDLLHVQARRAVEPTLALVVHVELLVDDGLHLGHALADAPAQRALAELERERLAPDRACGQREAHVLMHARVAARPERVPLREGREELRHERGVEQER
jgi:hypothetical protein